MAKYIIRKNMTQEQRLKAIKKAADRFNKKMGRNVRVRQIKYVYLAQIEVFKSRDLTDQEVIVMQWMEKELSKLREKSK